MSDIFQSNWSEMVNRRGTKSILPKTSQTTLQSTAKALSGLHNKLITLSLHAGPDVWCVSPWKLIVLTSLFTRHSKFIQNRKHYFATKNGYPWVLDKGNQHCSLRWKYSMQLFWVICSINIFTSKNIATLMTNYWMLQMKKREEYFSSRHVMATMKN